MMCNVFCKEFKGWCKSFTKTEGYLTILEGALLVLLIVLVVFLVLHVIACSKSDVYDSSTYTNRTVTTPFPTEVTDITIINFTKIDTNTTDRITSILTKHSKPVKTTLKIACTWKPLKKTITPTHYYEMDFKNVTNIEKYQTIQNDIDELEEPVTEIPVDKNSDWLFVDESDGEESNDVYKDIIMALVKQKPLNDVTFGCILTVITVHWTLTTASCIEAIEEIDSLDSYVIMDNYGEASFGRTHSIADVLVHPLYQGLNLSYDIAGIKAEGKLYNKNFIQLPNMIDYLTITIGEKFIILGYGPFRSVNDDRSLREAVVYTMPGRQCGDGSPGWGVRHLVSGHQQTRGGTDVGAVCAGVLYSRGTPCNYCAGTPLLHPRRRPPLLLGVMADNKHCGAACEPALYVNVAGVRDWIDSIIYSD